MNSTPNPTPAGWFPDPLGRHQHRYFNGSAWTADVANHGQRSVDPHGIGPAGSAGPGGSSPGKPTAAMVLGLCAVAIAWVPFLVFVGIVLALLALVFGIPALRGLTGRRKAITGVVTGALALVLAIVGVWWTVSVVRELIDFVDPAPNAAIAESCEVANAGITASGTLRNLGNDSESFSLYVVAFTDTGRRVVFQPIEIGPIKPGDTREWTAFHPFAYGSESCDAAVDVFGPFPFNLEMEHP